MKTSLFFALSVGLCLLVGCASDPMKPNRPDGKRVPINLTPPPVVQPVTPTATPAEKELTEGENSNG